MHYDDEEYMGTGSGETGFEEQETHDSYSYFGRGALRARTRTLSPLVVL